MQYHAIINHSFFLCVHRRANSRCHPIRTTPLATPRETRLVLPMLDRSVEQYFSAGLAASTRKVYSTALNRYSKFCNQYSLCTTRGTTPASEVLLCRYVTHLALDHVSANSLKVYLSAIRQLHLQQGLPPPVLASMPRLQQVLRGIKIS